MKWGDIPLEPDEWPLGVAGSADRATEATAAVECQGPRTTRHCHRDCAQRPRLEEVDGTGCVLNIPRECAGRLMGRNGAAIRALQRFSGCRVAIEACDVAETASAVISNPGGRRDSIAASLIVTKCASLIKDVAATGCSVNAAIAKERALMEAKLKEAVPKALAHETDNSPTAQCQKGDVLCLASHPGCKRPADVSKAARWHAEA